MLLLPERIFFIRLYLRYRERTWNGRETDLKRACYYIYTRDVLHFWVQNYENIYATANKSKELFVKQN